MSKERGIFSFLFLSIIIIAALASLIYFVVFKLYFTETRVSGGVQNFISAAFDRDSKIAKSSFSPLGDFKLKKLEIFKKGSPNTINGSLDSFESKVKLYKLLMGKVIIEYLNIDGFDLKFTYDEMQKINYISVLSKISKFALQPFENKNFSEVVRIDNIKADNGNFFLSLNDKTIIFRKIFIESSKLDNSDFFEGTLFFYLDGKNIKSFTSISLNFKFNKFESIIYISDVKCDGITIPGEGRISLKNKGFLGEFFAAAKQEEIKQILTDILGQNSYTELGLFFDSIKDSVQISYLK